MKKMKKAQLLLILSKYKALNQVDHLPDKEYLSAIYEQLEHYDPRFVYYAIMEVARTESSFNRYPTLSQIIKNLPNLSYLYRPIIEKGERLRQIAEKNKRGNPKNWHYIQCQKEIDLLKNYLQVDRPSQINKAVKKLIEQENAMFFGDNDVLQLTSNKGE